MNFFINKSPLFYLSFFIFFPAHSQQRYIPLRISEPILLDGKLDEPSWQHATPLSDFMQTDPAPGANPTERTEVYMLYNDEYLFVGYHCFDSEPNKIVRFMVGRDFEVGKDDGTSFALDTYHDKSSGVCFITNTLSGRYDSEITNNGNTENTDFNTFWDVASSVDSTGYTTEYRIPFSSLRFEAKEKIVMGFRLARLIKRKNELITYPRCDSSIANLWINFSEEAQLEFTNLKSKNPIYITPYCIGNFNQQTNLNNETTEYVKSKTFFTRKHYVNNETLDKFLSNIGCDMKYGISKNFTLDMTVNTDFAQAEVDNRIINLTKYEINLPEKRGFFLESQNYLNYSYGQSTQLFNSRTIGLENDVVVPIIAGVRMTGTQNNLQIAALDMQTSNVFSKSIEAQNFGVVRLRKFYDDKGSYCGGIFTNRISTQSNTVSNQSLGIDLTHRFNSKWLGGFGLANTYDANIEKIFFKKSFFNIFASKNANEGFSHAFNLELTGQNFNPAIGFIPETDYGFISLSNGKSTKVKGDRAINSWTTNTTLEYRWKLISGLTETKFANLQGGLYWTKGSNFQVTFAEYKEDRLYENWELSDNITIPSGYYQMFDTDIFCNYDESKSITAGTLLQFQDFYGGKLYKIAPEFNYIINRHFRIGINYEHNTIKFPVSYSGNGNSVYKSNLIAINYIINFSSKFSIKSLGQYDDGSDSFGGNIRFRYNPREGTDLYIVYNSLLNTNRFEAKPTLPVVNEQAIVIKFSKTFGL